ncbi:MAG: NAD-dependent epimerase/dehydratase family protein [Daejeonella sp.]
MILITGSTGFLGKAIIKELDHLTIETLCRSNSSYNFDLSKEIPHVNGQYECVIHAAGKAHIVPTTEDEKHDFFNINVNGTKNLLRGLEKVASLPKYFIFISSVAVYGLENGVNIAEDTQLNSVDPYGKSKIEAEHLVQNWCRENNILCSILRLPLLVGQNPPGNLGAMIKGIRKRYYVNIAGGRAKKSMVLAEDVAKIIPKVAKIGGIYNLTDDYHPSFKELSNLIADQLGKNQPLNLPYSIAKLIAIMGDLLGNIAPINSDKLKKITSDLTFDDSKAQNILGWNPTPVLKGLKIK